MATALYFGDIRATADEQTVAVLTLQLTAAATAANEGAVDAGTQIGNASSASQTADGAASQPDAIAAGPAAAAALAADPAAAAAVALVYPGPGYYFRVVLPHPSSGHADFVILHSRFQEAVSKTWHVGARVQVCKLLVDWMAFTRHNWHTSTC